MTDRPPPDATLNMNLGSLQNALRNIATLLPYDPAQAVVNLNMLADRAGDMWREQQERPVGEVERAAVLAAAEWLEAGAPTAAKWLRDDYLGREA